MTISSVSNANPLVSSTVPQAQRPQQAANDGPGFAERMGNAVQSLADAQTEARRAAEAYETGATDDLSAVMVNQEVASLGFQLALNVRNKALTAYRDIMNMPV